MPAVGRELSDRPVIVLVSSRDASVYRRGLGMTPARGVVTKADLSGSALADVVAG